MMLTMIGMAAEAQPYPNSGDQSVCLGANEPYGVINMPGSTYAWSVIPITGGNGTITGTGSSVTILWTSVGTCTLQVVETNAAGCIGPPVTIVVTVHPTPDVIPTPASQTICSNSSTSIALTGSVAGTTFSWTFTVSPAGSVTGASAGSGNAISQPLINTTPNPATVTYTVTPSANGCPGLPVNVTVTVNPTPVALATPAAQTICSNTSTNIALSSTTALTTFTWTVAVSPAGSVTGASAGGGNTISQPLIDITPNPATVTYTVIPSANGCPGLPVTVLITVNPTPVAIATPAAQTICSSNSTSVALSSATALTTYTWTVNVAPAGSITGATAGSGNLISQPLLNVTPNPATATYTVTPSANGCTGLPLLVVITVNPTPNVTATPSLQTLCSAGITGISLTSTTAGTTFGWTAAVSPAGSVTGSFASNGNTIAQTLTNLTPDPAFVTYSITPTANGCAGLPIIVVVTVNPTPNVTATPGSQSICSMGTTSIALSSSTALTLFNWTVAISPAGSISGAFNGNGSTISQTLTNSTPSPATVTYTVTPIANGCPGIPINVTITVNPLPVPTIAGPTPVCVNSSGRIYTTEAGMSNYNWTINGGTITAGAGTNAITVTWNIVGAHFVTVTYTNLNGCNPASSSVFPVTVDPLPVATISGPAPVCVNTTNNIYTTEPGMTNYSWTITGGTITGGNTSSSIHVTWNVVGIQTITVTYTDTNGCNPAVPATYPVLVNPLPSTSPIFHN